MVFELICLIITGAGTALLGKEGAMACTVAVEDSISEHYNNQIRTLMEEDPEKYKELLQVCQCGLKVFNIFSEQYTETIFFK